MKGDLKIFFLVLAIVAITGQLVRNGEDSRKIITAFFNGASSLTGTVVTGNPQFYAEAQGFGPSTKPSAIHTQTGLI